MKIPVFNKRDATQQRHTETSEVKFDAKLYQYNNTTE